MVILASKSKTRAKILKEYGVRFKQIGIAVDEEIKEFKSPKEYVCETTKKKLKEAVKKIGLKNPIIVADTVISVNGEILRKPKDRDDAKRLLKLQSGSKVSIFTCTAFKSKEKELFDLSTTDYIFEKFDEKDLDRYLESDKWRGKAGGCMVEGFCKKYIKEVKGLESCARGLTIEKILPLIKD